MQLCNRHSVFAAAVLVAAAIGGSASAVPQKEFLTPREITQIQDAQEIEKRVKIYLEAGALRLKTAEERLSGKESVEGDPLEFFTVEDMLDGYFRIVKAVMLNLDDAAQKPGTDQGKLTKALKDLKNATENLAKRLDLLKKMAEGGKLEKVWNLVNRAIDINNSAREGATIALEGRPAAPEKARPPKKPYLSEVQGPKPNLGSVRK